jgi:hypothetical protein
MEDLCLFPCDDVRMMLTPEEEDTLVGTSVPGRDRLAVEQRRLRERVADPYAESPQAPAALPQPEDFSGQARQR